MGVGVGAGAYLRVGVAREVTIQVCGSDNG